MINLDLLSDLRRVKLNGLVQHRLQAMGNYRNLIMRSHEHVLMSVYIQSEVIIPLSQEYSSLTNQHSFHLQSPTLLHSAPIIYLYFEPVLILV